MTRFLDDLERELRAAHPRRARAARRAGLERGVRRAPAAIATIAVLGGATAFVVSTGGDDATHSGAAPTLARIDVAVLGPQPAARAVRDFLAPRHGRVVLVPSRGGPRLDRSTVFYARGRRTAARTLAGELGLAASAMTEAVATRVRAPLAVVVGPEVTGGRTVPLTDPQGARRGTLTTVQSNGRRFFELTTKLRPDPFLSVWVRGGRRARFLGFMPNPSVTAELPEGDLYPELVVSRETSADVGAQPADVVLSAPLDR